MTQAEVEQRFPQAVAFARLMRDTFGADTKMIYAKNPKGESLGHSSWPPKVLSTPSQTGT